MYRIGYDAKRLFNNFTGLGNYSRTLLRNLADYYPDNAYLLYTPKIVSNEETRFFLNSAMYHVQLPRTRFKNWWRTSGVKKDLQRERIDLFHGLSHEIPWGIDKIGIRTIVTMHDVAFKRYPDYYPWIDLQIYDLKFRHACRQADRIVAISESTKRDIINYYGIKPEKIAVIYQSVHERFMQEKAPEIINGVLRKYQLPASFLLYVGSITKRKNLLNLVKALPMIPTSLQLPLVVIGKGGSYRQRVQEYIARRRMEKQVLFTSVDFNDLPAIYQRASVFIYPSYYEGFGIPLMEALFSRTPVVTTNVSSLPEAGGPGATLIDPDKPEAIANALSELLNDCELRKEKIETGYLYAQQFRGEPLARQMAALYDDLLK